MPKIIKDLDEIIFKSAFKLFGELGYKKTDMKKIAKESKIAVGTLYNYYSSKEELFLDVFTKSWRMTIEKAQAIRDHKEVSLESRLRGFIRVICDDVENRKGIGRDLAQNQVFKDKEDTVSFIRREMLDMMIGFMDESKLENARFGDMAMKREFASMVFFYVLNKMSEKEGEIDEIVEYIARLFDSVYGFC